MASNRTTSCVCVFFVLVLATSMEMVASQFLTSPFNVTGVVGKNVTIYCQVDTTGHLETDVYWGLPILEALGPDRNRNMNFPRHTFTGNAELGYYNLRITNVTADDAGEYSCIYERTIASGTTLTDEIKVNLSVVDEGVNSEIACTFNSSLMFNDMDLLPGFTCSATDGVPLAGGGDVRWFLVLRDNSYVEVPGILTVEPGTRVTSTIDSDKMILTGDQDNSYLACSTAPLGDKSVIPCFIPNDATELGNNNNRIRVMYPPLVRLLPSEIEVGMFETFELDIKCLADSNPPLDGHPEFDIDLTIENITSPRNGNDTNIENRLFTRLRISISRADIGKTINCTARNSLGTTTLSVEIKSLGGLPTWLICALILIGGILLFLVVLFYIICCCKCDLEHEKKRTERRRRTLRDSKTNGTGNMIQNDDELGDIDLHTYDQAPPVMMPESPQDSGNYPDSDSGESSAMVNDFKIEEPDDKDRRVSIGSGSDGEGGINNNMYKDDEDDDELGMKKREEYLQVTIADDTEGEDIQLDELSRETSPSLNELN